MWNDFLDVHMTSESESGEESEGAKYEKQLDEMKILSLLWKK